MIQPPFHLGLIPDFLAQNNPDSIAFRKKEGNTIIDISTATYLKKAIQYSAALQKIGISKGNLVITMMPKSVEWNFLDTAILRCGAIHIPFHHFNAETEHALTYFDSYTLILHDSLKAEMSKVDSSSFVLFSQIEQSLNAEFESSTSVDVSEYDVACIIYTLSNEGKIIPVALSHRGIVETAWNGSLNLRVPEGSIYLSLLPVAKSYERITQLAHQFIPATVQYSDPMVLPAMMIKLAGAASSSIVPAVLNYPIKIDADLKPFFPDRSNISTKEIPAHLLRIAFGPKFIHFLCGGAYLPSDILDKFIEGGINIFEGYGLTQASGGFVLNNPNAFKPGSLGRPFANMKLKIASDNEILVKGSGVCLGIAQKDGSFRPVADSDGWLHTGDEGQIDENGFLFMTGVKKKAFKLSNGYYYNPENDEAKLTDLLQANAMICRDSDGLLHLIVEKNQFDSQKSVSLKEFRSEAGNMALQTISIVDVLPSKRPFNFCPLSDAVAIKNI